MKDEQDNAKTKYEHLLEQLEKAMEDSDMIHVLEDTFPSDSAGESALVPLLLQNPADCPLLQHCAKQGWAAAVKWLVGHGFHDGLGYRGKHRMTVLHLVAWEGRVKVLEASGISSGMFFGFGHEWSTLCRQFSLSSNCAVERSANKRQRGTALRHTQCLRLPELSGFIRSQQLALETGQDVLAEACLEVAVACRRARTGDIACSREFVQEANAQVATSSSEAEVLLPVGVEAQAVLQHLQGPISCSDFVSRYVDLRSVPPLSLSYSFRSTDRSRPTCLFG